MKKVSSLKSLKKRKGCFIVKRGKRTYVLSDKAKFKACQ
jgi:ribosomal protein L36